jgi:hypothetical protein
MENNMSIPALTRVLDAMERQLAVSDEYAKQAKPATDSLPSVWQIQNSHIREMIAEARNAISQPESSQ